MLQKNTRKSLVASNASFVIVASKYNARFVDSMVHGAQRELKKAGAKKVEVIRVPGAYEIPVVAAAVTRRDYERPAAVICLGVILRGETTHASHIGEAVTMALMQIQVGTGVPMIHEVLLLENVQQAEKRCLSKNHNRGVEAAQTALEMARVLKDMAGA